MIEKYNFYFSFKMIKRHLLILEVFIMGNCFELLCFEKTYTHYENDIFLLLVNRYVPEYTRNVKNAATNIFTRLIKYESPFF